MQQHGSSDFLTILICNKAGIMVLAIFFGHSYMQKCWKHGSSDFLAILICNNSGNMVSAIFWPFLYAKMPKTWFQ
jgi:hypothetical protein